MSAPLNILHLEDNPNDAELARSLLKTEGLECCITVAQNRASFLEALDRNKIDLVISDYSLPSFDGMTALKLTREKDPDLPFIFLSGVMGEDAAIESLLNGATDYVLKQKIARFIPAIRRAVRESEDHRQRNLAREEIRKAADIKSEFISMVSHELRTPLTVIKEGVDIVLDGTDGSLNEKQKKHLQLAIKNVDRMARLINNVLSYQKLESGSMTFLIRLHDINELVHDAAEGFVPVLKKKGLEFKMELAPDLPLLWCDKDRLTELLANLLNNAIKFTNHGYVKVTTNKDEQWVNVTVEDQGIGIKEEDQPKLFESFSQLGDENGCSQGGTGLGLAISKKIIEKHHGRIGVRSVYRQGSAFCFSLPIQSAQTAEKIKRILVADDEADITDLIGARLSQAGYEVVCAVNGEEAWNLVMQVPPRLILLDYKMPLMNGHEVCRRIKADERLKSIPIIFLTASPQAATPELMQSLGADDYLIKPFQAPELFEKIFRFLQ